jgi:ATP-dependent protease ClpP protease subunit
MAVKTRIKSKSKEVEEKKEKEIKVAPVNFDKTQEIISQISKKLDAPLLTFWLISEASMHSIDVVGFSTFLSKLKNHKKVYILIKSTGGNTLIPLRMVNILRDYFEDITALVISECASASTMLALGSNEILMSSKGYLSAIDTSIIHELSPVDIFNQKVRVSLDELHRVTNLWAENDPKQTNVNPYSEIFKYIHPLVIGATDRASSLSIKISSEILAYHMKDKEKIEAISSILNSEYPQHGYPITLREAQRIGINAKQMPRDIENLLFQLELEFYEISQNIENSVDENRFGYKQVNRIFETAGARVFYEWNEDKFYRTEEKRWVTLRDDSSWFEVDKVNPKSPKKLHIRG